MARELKTKEKEVKSRETKPKDERSTSRRQPNAIQTYFRETVGELRKVSWPTRKEATNLTIVVLAVMLSMSLFLGTLDYLFSAFFELLLKLPV